MSTFANPVLAAMMRRTFCPQFPAEIAANSATAHCSAIRLRPNAVRFAMARVSRDFFIRRPSRYPASRWNIRWSLLR